MGEATQRYAVVTGANKGIGLEIVRQLASEGIKVVLTARNEERGLQALQKLKASGLSHLVLFHQLDVADAASVTSLADFIKSKFGKLDILVNNAGVSGVIIEDNEQGTKALTQTYELAEECLQINYYGTKITVQSLMPLLQLSDSPTIVNVSSTQGQLESFPKESWARGVLSDADNLTEEKMDEIVKKFLNDFKEGSLESNGWPRYIGAYIVSKAAVNGYTRILAKKNPSFCINSVCPGYVKTDITSNTGFLTVEEGAASPVRLALLPNGSPSDHNSELKVKMGEATQRYAVVTGANKGIGLEIVRQLASEGIKVVLTARNEERGLQALQKLKASGLSHLVLFHQLDVADAASVASLAHFIKSKFGKLDILVNNAGISGIVIEDSDLITTLILNRGVVPDEEGTKALTQTYELAEECLQINYYGTKITVESLMPLLQLSDSPTIVNVSSFLGQLENFPKESWARGVLSDADNLTEEKIDEIVKKFLSDFKEGSLESKGWPRYMGAYIVSKAAMNGYTRILAKKNPSFCINSVCPGYVKTDITSNTGFLTVEEGAASPVRLALLPNGSPSGRVHPGLAIQRYAVVTGANKGIGLEIVKQLASAGIKVVLTARNEERGLHAMEKIKASGLSHLVMFHLLDVADATSVASLADFIKSKFGKLDILVNNAGIGGAITKDVDLLPSVLLNPGVKEDGAKAMTQTYELAEECLQINYYGTKITVESLMPLLQLSHSPTIVNVSSSKGKLQNFPKESWARGVLSDADNLTEEKIDEIVKKFLSDFKEGSLESKGWPRYMGAYIVSKAAMNGYTRILAKKNPSFCINSVCPGYVKTDITSNTGFLTVEEGAASPVRLALLPNGSPSGLFYYRADVASF
ncbi:carbonyl reductase [Vigna unguiculata]|uniref:Carbonyl reductase n=1 Tax=Vigna unguiculata TaxID=3917 RepID=A0A4D6MRN2_VIGUN|nr:carbonyl reductase [Vigna unguiculata]